MALNPTEQPVAASTGQDIDPMELLAVTLQTDALMQTEDATVKLAQVATRVTNDAVQAETPMITNKSLDQLYEGLTGGGSKVIGYLPAGSTVTGKSNDIRTVKNPDGKITVIQDLPEKSTVKTNPSNTVREVLSSASNPVASAFDLDGEMKKLKGMRGQELLDRITTLQATLAGEKAKAMKSIDDAASIESGYTAAQAALDRVLAVDGMRGPMAIYGVPSYQTLEAQKLVQATLTAKEHLIKSKALKDPSLAKIIAANEQLGKLDARVAMKQINEDDKLDAITSTMIANYKMIYDSNEDDLTIRRNIASRITKDKTLEAAVSVTPDNVYEFLTHPDQKIRKNTQKLVHLWDNNTQQTGDTVNNASAQFLQPYIDNPALILQDAQRFNLITKDQLAQRTIANGQLTPKDRAIKEAQDNANLLARLVERRLENSYQNARLWKSDVISAASPLGKTIERIAASDDRGNAPMSTVVEAFIMDSTIKREDGSRMQYPEKVGILLQAIQGTVNNDPVSILYPNRDPMRNKVVNQVKMQAARAFVKFGGFYQNHPEIVQDILRNQTLRGGRTE